MPQHIDASSENGGYAMPVRPPEITIGDISLDAANYRVTRGVREVRIGPTEFRLLAFMMQNTGRLLSREQLRSAGWPGHGKVNPRTVDVYIGRLRRALIRGRDRDPIRTVRHAGYVFGLSPKKNRPS
jgi:two-component system phosphate regulon response regulator PhoB